MGSQETHHISSDSRSSNQQEESSDSRNSDDSNKHSEGGISNIISEVPPGIEGRRGTKRPAETDLDKTKRKASKPVNLPECPICMMIMSSDRIVTPPCGHITCEDCNKAILDSKLRKLCPICRKKMTRASIRKLYLV